MILRVCAVVAFAFWALAGCSSSSNTKSAQTNQSQTLSKLQGYQALATEKYGAAVRFMPNPIQSHILCLRESKGADGSKYPPLKFFVFDLKNNKVVFEETQPAGRVKWISDDRIEVFVVPGIVRGDEKSEGQPHGYIYDLRTGKKLKPATQNRDE